MARAAASASTPASSRTASRPTSAAVSRPPRAGRGADRVRSSTTRRSASTTSSRAAVAATGLAELDVRALTGEAKARARLGDVRRAIELLERARDLSEGPGFSDLERAEVLFRLGVVPLPALEHRDRDRPPQRGADARRALGAAVRRLRSNILHWRSRCYRRQRDYEAAREDVERALELAEGLSDRRTIGGSLLPGLAARRARRALGARAHVRGAGEGAVRGARRPDERRPAAQQPRRTQLPSRQARGRRRGI